MCENSWICEFLCAISKRMHLDWFDTYDPWHELFSGFYIFVGNLWSVYFFCYEKEINCMELFIRLKQKMVKQWENHSVLPFLECQPVEIRKKNHINYKKKSTLKQRKLSTWRFTLHSDKEAK